MISASAQWRLLASAMFLTFACQSKLAHGLDEGDGKPASDRAEIYQLQHDSTVWAATWSPDGKHVLTGDEKGAIRLWDVASGKQQRAFVGHENAINSLGFSSDGKRFLSSGGFDQLLILWDVKTSKQIHTIFEKKPICYAALAPDERTVLSATDVVRLLEVQTGKEKKRLEGTGSELRYVGFFADGTHALVADRKMIRFVNIETGKELARKVFAPPVVSLDPDAVAGREGLIAVRLSTGNKCLVLSTEMGMQLWSISERLGQEFAVGKVKVHFGDIAKIRSFHGHRQTVNNVALSGDASQLLSGSGREGWGIGWNSEAGWSWGATKDNTVRLWDVGSGKEVACFRGHTRPVTCVSMSPAGGMAISASLDGSVRLWKLPKSSAASGDSNPK